jgi:hypothetical protein
MVAIGLNEAAASRSGVSRNAVEFTTPPTASSTSTITTTPIDSGVESPVTSVS